LKPRRSPFFFAGIWRQWTGTRGTKAKPVNGEHLLFSFLTTHPNDVVKAIHPKAMPVLLPDELARETWMHGTAEEALALQRPAPDDALRIVAKGLKLDVAPQISGKNQE
jgi:putative SOS response-associated peptidase YedK